MQIDWLTVAAQAVNFLILVYLLRRFLYRPVMTAIARREEHITQQMQQAVSREQEAEQEVEQYRRKTEALERKRGELLSAGSKEVEDHRKSMLAEAREEVDAIRTTWRKEVEREQQEFLGMFKGLAAATLTRTARRVLADLAESELEQQLIRAFMKRLESLDHALLTSLRKSARKAGEIRVTTSFEANQDTRSQVKRAIQYHLLEGKETEIQFHQSAELICGIEVKIDAQKLGWTMADYLQALEHDLGQTLAQVHAPEEQKGA
jgi:F-type H+-transporting ATPase subunit b